VPWNLVLVWAAVAWARGARADLGERFLHAWWIVVVAVFTAAYGKRDIYLLPLYPGIALLAGRALAAALARAPSGPILGVVRVPAAVRRRFATRPALALVALALVAVDATVVTVSEIARFRGIRRRSLLPFVGDVEAGMPPDAPLYATVDVDGSDLQVLAYRLRRAIPRTPGPDPFAVPRVGGAANVYLIMPLAAADARNDPRVRRVATSSRRGTNIALVAVSADERPHATAPAE